VDTTVSADGWQQLGNSFERIADAEKTQWLPYYYAAVSNVMQGYMLSSGQSGGFAAKTDPLADKAEQLINKAEAMNKDNSDIWCVKKMIATLRMTADPMTRWQTYGPAASEALAKAKQLDPENPRVYLLEGQDKFYTPEQFGGSKTEAKSLFETSLQKFNAQKPKTSIDPQWGVRTVNYFLSQTAK
jgi:RecA-family ATPase